MKVLVSGSHGLVGQALIKSLMKDGNEVARLVRRERAFGSPDVEWHPDQGRIGVEHLEGFDAVVHLAGESIASGRWTGDKKRQILESRVKGTQLLTRSLAQLSRPPAVLITASAIGYYGDRGDEKLTEQSAPGNDFLAGVCVEWERAAEHAAEKGIRIVKARFGIILDSKGGALAKMLPPFRMGVGGRIGSGKQWMSWISLNDVVRIIEFALVSEEMSGPINVVSPNPVNNADFTKVLGRLLSRPTIFPIPAFGVRLAFGEMADALLLSSQRVEPAELLGKGFQFKYPELHEALSSALAD